MLLHIARQRRTSEAAAPAAASHIDPRSYPLRRRRRASRAEHARSAAPKATVGSATVAGRLLRFACCPSPLAPFDDFAGVAPKSYTHTPRPYVATTSFVPWGLSSRSEAGAFGRPVPS